MGDFTLTSAGKARAMKRAGCFRVFFGIESGNDSVLKLMHKKTTAAQSRAAVLAAHGAGLEVGAFFILCYPGESDDTVLETLPFHRRSSELLISRYAASSEPPEGVEAFPFPTLGETMYWIAEHRASKGYPS